ncbi:hypothetical protein CMI47_12535 [Candidatus Pacearchaeota archaeon]|jgi:hypothetical protein|nr:hypothetical protein [Candidatus Pacearchaeota archaeon]
MADAIGVLGEATTTTVGTTTVYTVPAAKAAKCKIQVKIEAHAANSTGDFLVTVNGVVTFSHLNLPTTEIMWSNSTTALHDPSTSVDPDGTTAALTCCPGPAEYYLSAGDTVTYTIGTDALVACNVQVVGTEIDV